MIVSELQDQQEHPRFSRPLRHPQLAAAAGCPPLLQHDQRPEPEGRKHPEPEGHRQHHLRRPLQPHLHRVLLLAVFQGDQPDPGECCLRN